MWTRSSLWNVMMRRSGAVRIRSSLGSEKRKLRGLQKRSGRLGNRCISGNMWKYTCADEKAGRYRRLGNIWKKLLSTACVPCWSV